MSAPLSVGSLFSGIGGFDLGLERTGGFRTAWFCEQDPYCQRVLAKHWPDVPIHSDITELHDPEPVDVLCGGFPCQDLSYAGAGAGIAGARSGLWSEYALLIRELRPRYVLVENVSALLARGMGTVLGDLAACGYDAEWDCIPASAVGAPHRRDRVWLVAYPQRDDGGSRGPGGSASGGAWEPVAVGALQVADAHRGGLEVSTELDGRQERPGRAASQRGHAHGLRDEVAHAAITRLEGAGLPRRPAHGGANVADAESEPVGTGLRADESAGLGRGRLGDVGRSGGAWAVEPNVGRVAHELSPELDRGGVDDDPERSSYQEARATGASHADAMRAVRSDGAPIAAPPGLLEAGGDRGPLSGLSSQGGCGGRDPADEEAEGLHDLRGDVHELQPLAGEDLLAAMSQRSWPPRGYEAMGWWDVEPAVGRVATGVPKRVDRLRALGNALVPPIAEWIGYRILGYEGGLT